MPNGFRQFVPSGKSFWEIGTGKNPQKKATEDFKKRILKMVSSETKESTYAFVTPRQWNQPGQTKWISGCVKYGWKEIRILDGVVLAKRIRLTKDMGRRIPLSDGRGLAMALCPAEPDGNAAIAEPASAEDHKSLATLTNDQLARQLLHIVRCD